MTFPNLTATNPDEIPASIVHPTFQTTVCKQAFEQIRAIVEDSDGESYITLIRSIVSVLEDTEHTLE